MAFLLVVAEVLNPFDEVFRGSFVDYDRLRRRAHLSKWVLSFFNGGLNYAHVKLWLSFDAFG